MGLRVPTSVMLYVAAILLGLGAAILLFSPGSSSETEVAVEVPHDSTELRQRTPTLSVVAKRHGPTPPGSPKIAFQVSVGADRRPATKLKIAKVGSDPGNGRLAAPIQELNCVAAQVAGRFIAHLEPESLAPEGVAVGLVLSSPGYLPRYVLLPRHAIDAERPSHVHLDAYARTISVKVLDLLGGPVPGVPVLARSTTCSHPQDAFEFVGGLTRAVSGEDGTLTLSAGAHHVALQVRDPRWVDFSYLHGSRAAGSFTRYRSTWGTVVGPESSSATLVVAPPRFIAAEFRDQHDHPVQTRVRITPVDSRVALSDVGLPGAWDPEIDRLSTPAPNGRFRCMVAPRQGAGETLGSYITVYVEAEGFVPMAARLQLQDGWTENPRMEIVRLSPHSVDSTASVSATVLRPTSADLPVPRMRRCVLRIRPKDAPELEFSGALIGDRGQGESHWVFHQVPHGKHTIEIDDGLGISRPREVHIDGAEKSLEVQMGPPTGLRVSVSTKQGLALYDFDVSMEAAPGKSEFKFFPRGSTKPVVKQVTTDGMTFGVPRFGHYPGTENRAPREYLYALRPGSHRILVRLPGYAPERRIVQLASGQVQILAIELQPLRSSNDPERQAANSGGGSGD